MTCREFELLLGAEERSARVDGHLGSCASCRELAADLRMNSDALGLMRDEALVVPITVRRPSYWKWASAVAAAMLAVGIGIWEIERPVKVDGPPVGTSPIIVNVTTQAPEGGAAPEPIKPRREVPRMVRAAVPRKDLQPVLTDPQTIRIQTSDPNVVIYWQMQSDEGDKI